MPIGYYVADSGAVYKIRLSQSDLTAQPTASGSHTEVQPNRAKVSKSNREYGVRPRGAVLGRTVGTAPNTIVRYKRFPVLLAADLATIAAESTFSVGGQAYDVLGTYGENIK